jgi:GWxTD domain-containing protein
MKSLFLCLFMLLFVCGCTLAPSSRRVIEDDFVEKIDPGQREHVWDEIAELKSRILQEPKSADMYRHLAVLYRLAGTPRARLLSIEAIDKAIQLDYRDPRNHVEKGLTLLARRFIGESEDSFQRAVKIDPECFEAWYQLGALEKFHYFKTMCFPDHLKKSIRYFRKANSLNRRDEDTLFNLAFLHMFRSMFRTSRKYAYKAIDVAPDNPRNYLLLGSIHLHFKKFDLAMHAFEEALELMPETERWPYENISLIIPSNLRDLYLTSSPEKVAEWNRKYWIEQDPTPSTDLNERHLEHYRRVFLASAILTDKRLDIDGFDTDRGNTLIKFGMPDKKYYDLGGLLSGGWIIWEYHLPHQSFRLFFHDEFLNGNFHFPIADSRGEMSIGIMENVIQDYEYPTDYKQIPIQADVALFRGTSERTRLEFSIGLPASTAGNKKLEWTVVYTIFDPDWNRVFLNSSTVLPDTLSSMSKLGEEILVHPFWVEILPRYLDCTCVVEIMNDEMNLRGIWRHTFVIRDLFGQSLKLSSIMLTVPGEEGVCSDILDPIPVYQRGEGLCMSYEIYNLKRGEDNLARYRLTYSIKNPRDDSRESGLGSTLSYIWSSITGKEGEEAPYVSSTLEQSTSMNVASDRLNIELQALERGNYLLVLEVLDLVTGQAAVEEKMFTVTDKAESTQ